MKVQRTMPGSQKVLRGGFYGGGGGAQVFFRNNQTSRSDSTAHSVMRLIIPITLILYGLFYVIGCLPHDTVL